MLLKSSILVLLLISIVNANLQCDLCKIVVGTLEMDLANDKNFEVIFSFTLFHLFNCFQAKAESEFLKGCNSVKEEKSKKLCELLFSKENFPLFVSIFSKKLGLTADQICKGIKAC